MTRGARGAEGTAFIGFALLACSSRHIGPPPSAPTLARPLDALPADLDIVLRLDLKRMRDTLGASTMTELGERAVQGLHGADKATDALLLTALSHTDTLWLGLRPSRSLGAADSVFVLSGRFADFDPHRVASTPPFQPSLDLGGTLRRYDRASPASRSAPARIYTRGSDLIVTVSEAELDSEERTLEAQLGVPPLEPAEKGVISGIMRSRALPPQLFVGVEPLLHLAERADRCEFDADLTSAGVEAEISLRFGDADAALAVVQALESLRSALAETPGRSAKFAKRVRLSSAAEYVTMRLALGRDELGELVNCHGAACRW